MCVCVWLATVHTGSMCPVDQTETTSHCNEILTLSLLQVMMVCLKAGRSSSSLNITLILDRDLDIVVSFSLHTV